MAHLFSDGFANALEKWTGVIFGGGGVAIETTNGRFDGRWFHLWNTGGNGGWYYGFYRSFPNTVTIAAQFGLKIVTMPNLNVLETMVCNFMDPGEAQTQCSLYINQGGFLKAYRGKRSGTLLGTSPNPLLTNTWYQIELKVTINGASPNPTGSYLLKVNGATELDLNSINTRGGSAHDYANGFGINLDSDSGINYGLSDVIVMDTNGSYMNDLLGIRQVKPCMPTANGNYAQWTPSTGQNWQCVDEVPANGDTDYNSINTVGSKDTFVVPDIDANAVVDAVVMDLYCKTADPSAITLKGLARSNSQDGEGSVVTVPGSYAYLQSVIYRDPNGNIAWNGASFNAAEFGYKKET